VIDAPTRRDCLRALAGASVGTVGLAGCLGGSTGTLATRVSDRPGDIDDFGRCVVTITELRLKPTDGDRRTIDVDDATADLTELRGDASTLVDETELETGEFERLQLRRVDAALEDGSDAVVETPGDAPLTFETGFEIREDSRTAFTADFTPVKRGGAGGYVLQPVADEVSVSYEQSG